MHISKVCLILSLGGVAAWPLYSQPASSDSQARALELLRQTISQQQPVTPGQPASSSQQQQALDMLHQKVTEGQNTGTAPAPAATKPKPEKKPATSKTPAASAASSGSAVQPGITATTTVTPTATPSSGGAKTKQERLSDLNEQYMANKLTPAEYHAQRAKILAEP
jgi:hypothetical protein